MKNKLTSHKLIIEPYTQWEPGVLSPGSACGPATMAALAEYWNRRLENDALQAKSLFPSKAAHINHLYSHHGGRPWGMSVRSFLQGIKAYIRASGLAGQSGRLSVNAFAFNDWALYKAEIDARRPVAIKFDKWFSFRWRGRYAYDYHWVVGIGYEEPSGGAGPVLIIHDNGGRYKDGSIVPGRERRVDYSANRSIITMVALDIGAASAPL